MKRFLTSPHHKVFLLEGNIYHIPLISQDTRTYTYDRVDFISLKVFKKDRRYFFLRFVVQGDHDCIEVTKGKDIWLVKKRF